MCAIGIDLSGCMKNDGAVLLPKLYNEFKALCMLRSTKFERFRISYQQVDGYYQGFTIIYFENSLQAHCRHKRHDTMLMHNVTCRHYCQH